MSLLGPWAVGHEPCAPSPSIFRGCLLPGHFGERFFWAKGASPIVRSAPTHPKPRRGHRVQVAGGALSPRGSGGAEIAGSRRLRKTKESTGWFLIVDDRRVDLWAQRFLRKELFDYCLRIVDDLQLTGGVPSPEGGGWDLERTRVSSFKNESKGHLGSAWVVGRVMP